MNEGENQFDLLRPSNDLEPSRPNRFLLCTFQTQSTDYPPFASGQMSGISQKGPPCPRFESNCDTDTLHRFTPKRCSCIYGYGPSHICAYIYICTGATNVVPTPVGTKFPDDNLRCSPLGEAKSIRAHLESADNNAVPSRGIDALGPSDRLRGR